MSGFDIVNNILNETNYRTNMIVNTILHLGTVEYWYLLFLDNGYSCTRTEENTFLYPQVVNLFTARFSNLRPCLRCNLLLKDILI